MISTILYCMSVIIFIRICVKITAGRTKSNVSLIGKTVLITGGNSGLGLKTAMVLAGRGCRLIIASRNNTEEIRQKIIRETHNPNIITKYLDLGSLESVRAFAKDINDTEERLDILVNNAGTPMGSSTSTKDGLVTIMHINYFGSFLLTHLLIGLLKKSAPSRIVFVTSLLAWLNDLNLDNLNVERHWSPIWISIADVISYGNSKLCQIIASRHFAKNLKDVGITSNCVHPGLVWTPIFDKWIAQGWTQKLSSLIYYVQVTVCAKSVDDGAEPIIECCLANELQEVTGGFFLDCFQCDIIPSKAYDKAFADKFWDASEKFVQLQEEEKLVNI